MIKKRYLAYVRYKDMFIRPDKDYVILFQHHQHSAASEEV